MDLEGFFNPTHSSKQWDGLSWIEQNFPFNLTRPNPLMSELGWIKPVGPIYIKKNFFLNHVKKLSIKTCQNIPLFLGTTRFRMMWSFSFILMKDLRKNLSLYSLAWQDLGWCDLFIDINEGFTKKKKKKIPLLLGLTRFKMWFPFYLILMKDLIKHLSLHSLIWQDLRCNFPFIWY